MTEKIILRTYSAINMLGFDPEVLLFVHMGLGGVLGIGGETDIGQQGQHQCTKQFSFHLFS